MSIWTVIRDSFIGAPSADVKTEEVHPAPQDTSAAVNEETVSPGGVLEPKESAYTAGEQNLNAITGGGRPITPQGQPADPTAQSSSNSQGMTIADYIKQLKERADAVNRNAEREEQELKEALANVHAEDEKTNQFVAKPASDQSSKKSVEPDAAQMQGKVPEKDTSLLQTLQDAASSIQEQLVESDKQITETLSSTHFADDEPSGNNLSVKSGYVQMEDVAVAVGTLSTPSDTVAPATLPQTVFADDTEQAEAMDLGEEIIYASRTPDEQTDVAIRANSELEHGHVHDESCPVRIGTPEKLTLAEAKALEAKQAQEEQAIADNESVPEGYVVVYEPVDDRPAPISYGDPDYDPRSEQTKEFVINIPINDPNPRKLELSIDSDAVSRELTEENHLKALKTNITYKNKNVQEESTVQYAKYKLNRTDEEGKQVPEAMTQAESKMAQAMVANFRLKNGRVPSQAEFDRMAASIFATRSQSASATAVAAQTQAADEDMDLFKDKPVEKFSRNDFVDADDEFHFENEPTRAVADNNSLDADFEFGSAASQIEIEGKPKNPKS